MMGKQKRMTACMFRKAMIEGSKGMLSMDNTFKGRAREVSGKGVSKPKKPQRSGGRI